MPVLWDAGGRSGGGERQSLRAAQDVAYVDETSDDMLPSRLRLWLKSAARRSPQDIIADMLARDAETAEILENIRGML